jgi:hypothetical protein
MNKLLHLVSLLWTNCFILCHSYEQTASSCHSYEQTASSCVTLMNKHFCWSKLCYLLPLCKFDACNARKPNRCSDKFTKWRILSVFFETAVTVHDSWSNSKFVESITRLKQSHKFLLVKEFQLETWAVVWSTVRHNHLIQSEAQGSLIFGTLVNICHHFWRDFCVLCEDNVCLKGDPGYY